MATIDITNNFVKVVIFIRTPWPILCDDNYSIVQVVWTLNIECQNWQRPIAGASIGTQSVCQLPYGAYNKIDPQLQHAIRLVFSLLLLYPIYNIHYTPR